VSDSNYGAIGNAQDKTSYRDIDQQGRYLGRAAQALPGQQVVGTTTAPNLQVLATRSAERFSIQLVNYDLHTERSVTVNVTGRTPGSRVTRWELSGRDPSGTSSTIGSLASVTLPAQSVVILSGQR
jgi:hypothetical protein